MNLQRKAMLANLNICQWSGRKYDKKVSTDVEVANQATDAGRFNKQLIDKKLLNEMSTIAGRLRVFHYENTLPWGDNGDRLLPSARFFDYTAAVAKYRDEFASAVSRFIAVYPSEVQAARVRLGLMYDPDDYPDASTLAARFTIEASFMPVPAAADFRVDLGDEEVAAIKTQINETVAARQLSALTELWGRLYVAVDNMQHALSAPAKIFRDSLVENLRELATLIPKLNIEDNERLNGVCRAIRHSLLVNCDMLRTDKVFRANTAATANLIRAQISDEIEKANSVLQTAGLTSV